MDIKILGDLGRSLLVKERKSEDDWGVIRLVTPEPPKSAPADEVPLDFDFDMKDYREGH